MYKSYTSFVRFISQHFAYLNTSVNNTSFPENMVYSFIFMVNVFLKVLIVVSI